MTTVKVKFRPSTVKGRPGTIVYFVTHRRVVRQITTGYKVFPHEWDDKQSSLAVTSAGERTTVVQAVVQRIRRDLNRLDKIINGLNSGKRAFATDEIVRLFHETEREASFFEFMVEVILQLERLGKERTAENYTTAINSFKRFRNGNDIMLNEIDSDLMTEYEAYLKSHDVAMNTVSFYNRILRAVYNRAVEKEMTVQRYPFKHVYTGIDKTVKRAVPLKFIKRIKELDLSFKSSLDFARDMFLFSFYTRGMSFIDMAYLKKKDLQNGILSYRRRKTGQQLFIKWEKSMQEIIDKYPANENGYLLPIIKTDRNERLQYRNALRLVNNKLKEISVSIGLQAKLTMYVSRHTMAMTLQGNDVPREIISQALGHRNLTTTNVYLDSFSTSVLDKVAKIL